MHKQPTVPLAGITPLGLHAYSLVRTILFAYVH